MRHARAAAAAFALLLLTSRAGSPQDPRPSPPPVDKDWAAALGLVHDYDEAAKVVKVERPVYPKDAFEKHVDGTVLLDIAIDASGHVSDTRVVQSVAGLDEAAIRCVKAWIFKPAQKDGRPVATAAPAPVVFRISSQPLPGTLPAPPGGADGRSLSLRGFDSRGAHFAPWFAQFATEVYEHWVIPKQAKSGHAREADLEFVVDRDGRVSKIQARGRFEARLDDAGTREFEAAVSAALRASHLPPLPADYEPPTLLLRVLFSFVKPQPAKN